MKNFLKIFFVFAMIFNFSVVFAEKLPEKDVIEEKHLSNDIPVYFMKNTANHIDCVIVGVKGGIQYYGEEMSGIEKLTFEMMCKGSENYSYDEIQNLFYDTTSAISVKSALYGSRLVLRSIDEYVETMLPVMLESFVSPQFPESEFEKSYTDCQTELQSQLNEPIRLAMYYATKVLYENHPFAISNTATPESINNLTLDAVKEYYKTLLDSRRFYVIAVTNKSSDDLMPYFEKYLGKIGKGTEPLKEMKIEDIKVKEAPMVFTHQAIAGSSHVFRAFSAPSIRSEFYEPFAVAKNIYDKILFSVVRGKYGACYSVFTGTENLEAGVGFEVAYRCSDFSDIKNHMKEAREILKEGKYITNTNADGSFVYGSIKDDFENFKNSMITSYYESEITTRDRAADLDSSILLFGDTTSFKKIMDSLTSVTYEQVMQAVDKYILTEDDFWFGVTGPEDEDALMEALTKN